MDAHYRDAREADLPECADLFLASLQDMRARHNSAASTQATRAEMQAFYAHVRSTGILRVAEVEGEIAALACAILRDHLWFCAGFWARPGLQRRGIGLPLLRSVWEAGRLAGSRVFFVWSSDDLPAMASYMKLGMLPGWQILSLEGTPTIETPEPTGYTADLLDRRFASDLDEQMLGSRREVDHDYWSALGLQGRRVSCNGTSIGYYYHVGGSLGPAAWTEPQHAEALLTLAFRELSETHPKISLEVPGINHRALRFAFDSGLRLTDQSHLFTSARFGRLDQYLPSGPGLF